jgi:hypothetical protein
MDCINCNANIPPQYVNALSSNICPGCGGQIMSVADRDLLTELRDAMAKMPNDPEGLAGWLLSNYKLHKIGTAEPTSFHRAGQHRQEVNIANIKIADNPVHKFLQRTGYAKQLDGGRKRLRDIVSEIDNNVGIYNQDYDPNIDLDSGQAEDYDEEVSQIQPVAQRALTNNSLVTGGGPVLNQDEMEAMSAAISMAGQTVALNGDLPPALQLDRLKRLQQQQGVASGGGNGPFRRGG